MEVRAVVTDILYSAQGRQRVTFEFEDRRDLRPGQIMRLKASEWREKRSLDANGLLWHCIDKIASALKLDKWDVYLMMLKRYGVFTYGVFRENHLDQIRHMWRTSEVVGEVNVNGEKGIQVLLYFGSSTYDTKEFSRLLDGVIDEMEQMGLETPDQAEAERLLKEGKGASSAAG